MNDDKAVRRMLHQWEYRFRDALARLLAIEDGSEEATDPTESAHDRRDQRELLDCDSPEAPGLLQRIAAVRRALDVGEHFPAMLLLADLGYRTGRADAWQDWRAHIQGLRRDQWQVKHEQRGRGKKKKGKLKKAKRGINVKRRFNTLRGKLKNASALEIKRKLAKETGLGLTTIKARLSG